MNAILTMSQFIFPLITFPYVSRILLPEGTGKVSFATSVVSYFAMFAQLGIPTYGILVSVVTSLGVVLLPRALYYVEHNMIDEFYRITKKAINFVFLVATPLMLYFVMFAKEGVFFLSGSAYAGSIVPMQIIMPTLLLIGLTNIMGIQMLVPLGREKMVLYSEIVGVIVDIILNAILIPRYASAGAAIGTLAAEAAVFIVQYIALRNEVKEAYKNVYYGSLLLALVVSSMLAMLLKHLSIGNFILLCVSAMVFFGVYFGILTIMKEPLVIDIENQVLKKARLNK